MFALTIQLPDDTAERLKSIARSRGMSMNRLVEEMSAQALSAWDTENHFRALAASGDLQDALAILDRLDAEAGADPIQIIAYRAGRGLGPEPRLEAVQEVLHLKGERAFDRVQDSDLQDRVGAMACATVLVHLDRGGREIRFQHRYSLAG